MTFKLIRGTGLAVAGLLLTGSAMAQRFDLEMGFATSGNPVGPVSFGYTETLGSPLILHMTTDEAYGFPVWRTDLGLGAPLVGFNSTEGTLSFSTITLGAHLFILHPGSGGQDAVLRYTVPAPGDYEISGVFAGADTTTTDVHLLANNASVFDGIVSGFGASVPFDVTVSLPAGGTIDFAVGPNGGFLFDSTTLRGSITTVPEPGTNLLAAVGGLAVGMATLRRRKISGR